MSTQLDEPLKAELSRFIPASLLNKLPQTDALRDAITHIGGLHAAVKSFLPLYIVENEDAMVRESSALRPGAFLFADVSGFTALSEKIQQHSGSEGAEVLTAVIIGYFSTMLEILAKSNGQLLKFAGDALLAFFPSEGEAGEEVSKAIRTGLRMQRAMGDGFQPVRHEQLVRLLGSEHGSSLTMSIGIARGKLFEALVGNSTQRDHLIQGDLPGLAMQAEGVGERDEVIIDGDLVALMGDQFRTMPLGEGFHQIIDDFGDNLDDYEFAVVGRRRGKSSALFDLEQENLLQNLRAQVERVRVVSRFVAPMVLAELVTSGDFHLHSENRYTTTVFVHATGFAEMLAAWGEDQLSLVTALLGRYYNIVQRIVYTNGGTLARTDPYKLGTKLLITFGTPIAHPDDPDRAVAAAMEMMHQVAQFNERLKEELSTYQQSRIPDGIFVKQRIGITQGETFSGEVGWKQRREFTVMGDDVNLAARLMANAQPSQILISSRVYKRVEHSIEAEALPPLILKGKRMPVQAYVVHRAAPTIQMNYDSAMPFIGHDMFMLSLTLTLQQATRKRRRAVALVGDAGIGKTRIATQLAKTAESSGFAVAWTTCQSRNNRKSTWSALIAQLLGLDMRDKNGARRTLQAQLETLGLPHLDGTLSDLLFDVVDGVKAPVKRATSELPPLDAPPAALPLKKTDSQETKIADIFARVSNMSKQEMKTSGMFGQLGRATADLAEATSAPTDKSGLWKQAEQRTSLQEAIITLLKTYTEKTPTLLVIDDLHLDHDTSRELLEGIMKAITQAQLVIVVTFEPTKPIPFEGQILNVPDLDQNETNTIAMAILHVSELDARLRALLWARTSGRPLFIESLLRSLIENNFIFIENGHAELRADADLEAMPENVRELVISRIDHLTDTAQHVVRAAAVLDDSTLEALSAVSQQSSEPLQTALDELMRVQILQENGKGLYTFRHGMTQAVIYETLSRMQRVKLHRAAVTYYQAGTGVESVINAAWHMTKCGLLPQAVEWVMSAADKAEANGDLENAIEYTTHALTLFPDEKGLRVQLERLQETQNAAREGIGA